jgi:hypothetical protein
VSRVESEGCEVKRRKVVVGIEQSSNRKPRS